MSSTLSTYNEVEWNFADEYTDEILSGVNTYKIFDIIKKIDKLPLDNALIYFSEDTWDFTKAVSARVPKRRSVYKFDHIPVEYKEQAKFFILSSLWKENNKIQSIYHNLSIIRKFLCYLSSCDISRIEIVSLKTVVQFFEENSLAPSTEKRHKDVISSFFLFCNSNYNKFDYLEIKKYLAKYDSAELSAQRESGKWPTIPRDYFNRLLSCMIKVMNEASAPINDRGIAAETVLLSQTGLRQGDLTSCTIDALKKVSILNGDKETYYLEYDTVKSSPGNNTARHVYTAINELAYFAYTNLLKIYSEKRKQLNSNLLFTPSKAHTFPVTENTLARMIVNFLLKYGDEVGCINAVNDYPELKVQPIDVLIDRHVAPKEILDRYERTDTISYPRSHQFRVHLCSELYNQGVPLVYIQQFMAHLTKEMTSYYIGSSNDKKKEQEYAESVMRMIVSGDVNILGDNIENLKQSINKFILAGKYNVSKDLDTIIRQLTTKYPIRAKSRGICIKSGPIRDCRHSDLSDEIYCAYGMCPNNYHTFFMIDQSYLQFVDLVRIVDYNQTNGFLKAAEKEKNKIYWLLEKFLIPEYLDLEAHLSKKGVQELIDLYPAIKWHIENIDLIKEELCKWKTWEV